MADSKHAAVPNGAGRPRTRDLLDIFIFVDRALRKTGLSLRALVRDRNFIFDGQVTMLSLERTTPVRRLKKETLRRRYGQAREAMGLTKLPAWCLSSTAHEEVQREAHRFLEELRSVFPD